MKKHDGALASNQAGAVYNDLQQEKKALEDMHVLSIAHARQQNLIQKRHQVGGATFQESHTIAAVEFTEVEVSAEEEEEELTALQNIPMMPTQQSSVVSSPNREPTGATGANGSSTTSETNDVSN